MFLILIYKYSKINYCIILLLAALFSIIWRSIKVLKGKEIIEKNNNNNYSYNNPFFILDFTFAILAYMCIIFAKQINIKFIFLTLFIFIFAWIINIYGNIKKKYKNKMINSSQTIHFCGHCYVVLFVYITFFLYIY